MTKLKEAIAKENIINVIRPEYEALRNLVKTSQGKEMIELIKSLRKK